MERLAYPGGDSPMITKDIKFDAVRMMREIRDELSRRYSEYPSAEERFAGDKGKIWDKWVRMVDRTSDNRAYLGSCFWLDIRCDRDAILCCHDRFRRLRKR